MGHKGIIKEIHVKLRQEHVSINSNLDKTKGWDSSADLQLIEMVRLFHCLMKSML